MEKIIHWNVWADLKWSGQGPAANTIVLLSASANFFLMIEAVVSIKQTEVLQRAELTSHV